MANSGQQGPRETAAGLKQDGEEGGEIPQHAPARNIHEDAQQSLHAAGTPQDVTSARAKSQRKGKVTADHWNQ